MLAEPPRGYFFLLEGRLRRILTGMKRWYLYLIIVPLGLVILVYLIVRLTSPINFVDMWSRNNQARNARRKSPRIAEARLRELAAIYPRYR